jgi:hypothetical protein
MNAAQRETNLKRIILDIEELTLESWHGDDIDALSELLKKAESIRLVGYDD